MSITVQIRTVYGNEMIYPVDNNARVFCFLTGKKTLNRRDISKIKELGYAVNVQQEVNQL
jgi:hypothetical protein